MYSPCCCATTRSRPTRGTRSCGTVQLRDHAAAKAEEAARPDSRSGPVALLHSLEFKHSNRQGYEAIRSRDGPRMRDWRTGASRFSVVVQPDHAAGAERMPAAQAAARAAVRLRVRPSWPRATAAPREDATRHSPLVGQPLHRLRDEGPQRLARARLRAARWRTFVRGQVPAGHRGAQLLRASALGPRRLGRPTRPTPRRSRRRAILSRSVPQPSTDPLPGESRTTIIHSYDFPALASRAVACHGREQVRGRSRRPVPARRCTSPSHTFKRLGYWHRTRSTPTSARAECRYCCGRDTATAEELAHDGLTGRMPTCKDGAGQERARHARTRCRKSSRRASIPNASDARAAPGVAGVFAAGGDPGALDARARAWARHQAGAAPERGS
jgi:hypothetical protein